MRRVGTLLALLCGSLSLACQASEVDACSKRPLRMATAASLREVGTALVDDLARAAEPLRIEVTFGASSALAYQIKLGAPIDVLISADERIVDDLLRADLIVEDASFEIARGRLVLAAAADSAFAPLGLEALRSPEWKRLGLPHNAVPLGRYGSIWLESVASGDSLEGRIVRTEDARANLAALQLGHVDLAILYETDLRLAPDLVSIHRPDPSSYPPIRYLATRTRRATDCREVDRLLDAWRSPETQRRLQTAGFDPPLATRSERAPANRPRAGEAS